MLFDIAWAVLVHLICSELLTVLIAGYSQELLQKVTRDYQLLGIVVHAIEGGTGRTAVDCAARYVSPVVLTVSPWHDR